MTRVVYPTERKLLSVNVEEGTATVWQGALDYVKEYTIKGKVVAREAYGGFGGATITLPIRQVMTRKEHRQLTSFLNFRKTLDECKIPIEKQEIKEKMYKKFGTLDYETLRIRVLEDAKADPRLYFTTRRGSHIKTTISENEQFRAERNAGLSELSRP